MTRSPRTRRDMLPAVVAFQSGWDYKRFAEALAVANDMSLQQLMGRSLDDKAWRTGHPAMVRTLAELSGADADALSAISPYRYPVVVRDHHLSGYIDPTGSDPETVLNLLGNDAESSEIREQMASLPSAILRTRLTRLDRLISAIRIPWAPKSDVLPTPLRAAGLRLLWHRTAHDAPVEPREAELVLSHRWRTAGAAIQHTHPALGQALIAAQLSVAPALNTRRRLDRQLDRGGPFSAVNLREWSWDVIRTLHALDTARFGLRGEAHSSLVPPRRLRPEGLSHRELRIDVSGETRLEHDLLTGTPEGQQLITIFHRDTMAAPVPLEVRSAGAWWTARVRRDSSFVDRTAIANGIYAPSWALMDLMWIDLTGHLPATPGNDALVSTWQLAARQAPPDTLLQLRNWAVDWVEQTTEGLLTRATRSDPSSCQEDLGA